jgi:hypothetical protein
LIISYTLVALLHRPQMMASEAPERLRAAEAARNA